MISLRTNAAALTAIKNLNQTQRRSDKNLQRLSTGLRIVNAGDDPAGIGMSTKMQARIRSLSQAERNAQDGLNMAETASGAITEMSGLMIRMRELAVQASTSTLGSTERSDLNTEFSQLRAELDRIVGSTEYNDTTVLDGSASGVSIHVSADSGPYSSIVLKIPSLRVGSLGSLASASLLSSGSAASAISSVDGAINITNTAQAGVGATMNRLDASSGVLASERDSLTAANSRIRDADLAVEASEFARNQVLMDAGLAVLAQANRLGANAIGLIGI
jgi:flagellin